MSDSSNNIAVITHLKDKLHKWKNATILALLLAFLILLNSVFDNSQGNVDGGADYIANVKISDVILEDDYRSEILEKIAKEDAIKAVIIDIDSPGGGIVGSEILYNNLREIAQKKPLVVVMGSVAASGGYMAAIAADYIIAHNGTLTGSIGVLMQSAEITDLANKIGVKFQTYKSSPLKASPSPFEKSNPLVDRVINESIKDSANFFFDLVRERRGEKLNQNEIHKIFDGRVFTGRQAFNAGLIDEIGGKQEALNYLNNICKIDTKSLELREVSIVKTQENFVEKLLGFVPFLHQAKSFDSKNGIMAILTL